MDAFFAAVEERDRPRFKGKPIVVGSDPMEGKGRGVVSTANYKAREYGIKSALPISKAWQFSEEAKKKGKPGAIFLTPNFDKYSKSSENVMKILQKFSPVIEEASIDEAYFDLSFTKNYKKAEEICLKVKKEIKQKEKLTCSIGIGPNKLIAKIASDQNKPDGLTIVFPEKVESFLEEMSIRKISGIGPKTERALNQKNIKTIKDLKKLSQDKLKQLFGKWGLEIYDKAMGKDYSPLVTEWEAKSIGEQETFLEDTLDQGFIAGEIKKLCEGVFQRFRESSFKNFKTITITVRFSDFETITRAHTMLIPSNSQVVLEFEVLKLLMPFLDRRENPKRKKIRLIGARIERLSKG